MKGIVVTGGDAPNLEHVIKELNQCDIIVAADSGLETLDSYGFKPDLLVGDMDSIRDRRLIDEVQRERIIIYPEDKDFTDTELAIAHLFEKNCDEIILIGGGGGRLDHLIAIYSLFSRDKSPLRWYTHKEKIFLVKQKFCINLNINTLISLFPVGGDICEMTSSGLKWPLDELSWKIGDGGISNVACEESVNITMKSGKLLMIIPLDEC